jgi:protein phosphatase
MKRLWQALVGRQPGKLASVTVAPENNGFRAHGCASVATIATSALTSVGSVREVNEDAISIVCPAQRETSLSRGVLAVVADGMGGVQGGRCASQTAVDVVTRSFLANQEEPPIALRNALELANTTIYNLSRQDSTLEGMGTTCVAVVLSPEEAWVAWVGHSRVYLIRDGRIFQMTEDHSIAAELVRGGVLTPEQATCYEDRHVLTRALGTRPEVEVAVWDQSMPVRSGDRFLLCTDALHDALTETDLLHFAGHSSLEKAGMELIDRANGQGGYDNISSVLLEVTPAADGGHENGNSNGTTENQTR